jgi:hypothetical protein
VSNSRETLSWRSLGQSDLPAVTDLARRCLALMAASPAANPGFPAQWHLPEAETFAYWNGPFALICVSSLRRLTEGAPAERQATTR